ncbi:hypothetical protein [Chitinivorax sp. B]|nr:hypothetical protein [Chitinivorax sp. B]
MPLAVGMAVDIPFVTSLLQNPISTKSVTDSLMGTGCLGLAE